MGTAVNIFIATCLILCASSRDVFANNCRSGCTQDDGKSILQYQPGQVYEYNFDSALKVQVNDGAVDGGSSSTALKVTGIAKVYAEGNCGYTLQLANVKVTAIDEKLEKQLPAAAIEKPVHFTWQSNGVVEPQLCADANDNQYVLNIKRGIVSLLQATQKTGQSNQETDIFGQCPTYTVATETNGQFVVNKIRNLHNCAYREQLHDGIVTGVVNEHAGIHSSMLLLNADYNYESKFANGIINNVHLTEQYEYAAVRKDTAHVRASVLTNLHLRKNGAPGNAPGTGNTPVPIIFQQPDTQGTKNMAALKAQLNEIIQHSSDYIEANSARAFVELIRLMRNSDMETLLELSNVPHPNKVLARKVYLDALFRTATKDSARAIFAQLNKLDDKEKTIALLSLNLVQVVDSQTLQQAANLLNPNTPQQVYVIVGNLVAKYCHNHECGATDKAIELLSKKFVDNLKHCRAATRKDEDRIVNVLRGIANAGNAHLDVNVLIPALNECIAPANSARIRVNALQSYGKAASCDPQLHQQALQVLRNHNEDSEVRIEAYLAVTTCPNAELANHLADILSSEKVYQVGGFITSHLKALRDSTDATREQQRHYLGNIRLLNKFPIDQDRYSYNNEISYKLEALGLSASIDSKVIYSQQDMLPRSSRLNVTAEFFGTNFNVLDASIRQQNLEYILEYYLGPKGLANRDLKDIMNHVDTNGRARRSIADETAKLSKKYKTNKNTFDINLDLSLKMFGSELMFLSLGDRLPGNFKDVIEHFSHVHEKVKQELSNFERQFHTHCLFLDAKLQYATGVGIPLEFTVQGLAANRLDVALNVDLAQIMNKDLAQAKARIKLVPSIDVNVQLQLGFNAYVLQVGARLDSNFHTANGADVSISVINNGDGLNFDVELPREKLELFDVHVQRDFYVTEQDKPLRSSMAKHQDNAPKTPMCFNQLESFGFNFCVVASEKDPSSVWQVNATPLHVAAYITSERHFNVRATNVIKPPNNVNQFKLEYSTPGSQVPHNAAVTLEAAMQPSPYARIEYSGNNNRYAAELGLSNTQDELALYTLVEDNGNRRRNRLGFQKHGNEYRPVIEVHDDNNGVRNDIHGYRADGRIIIQEQSDNKRIQFDNLQVYNPKGDSVKLSGYTDLSTLGYKADLHLTVNQQNYAIKSHLATHDGQGVEASLFVNNERTPQSVWGASTKLNAGDGMQNIEVAVKAHIYEVAVKHELSYKYASDDNQAITSASWHDELSVKRQQDILVAGTLTGALETASKLHLKGELTYGKKHGSLNVQLNHGGSSDKPFTLSANAKYNKHFVDVQARGQPGAGQRLRVDGGITSSLGTSITYKGEIGQRVTLQDVYIDLNGVVQLTAQTKALQYAVKVNGAADRTNSELHITQDGVGNLLTYTGSWTHAQERINGGNAQLQISDSLKANGEFKVAKNGKGDVTAVVETLKTQQPHKMEINSKFQWQAPKYDMEVTVNFDGTQQIHAKTENVIEKQKVNSKNILKLANHDDMTLDIHGLAKGEWVWNGELLGNFKLHTSCGHTIDGDFKRKMQTNQKTTLAHGTLDLQLNHQLPKGAGKRSLTVHQKLDQFNWQQRNLIEEMQLTYTTIKGEDLQVQVNVKHLPAGQDDGAKEPLRKFELNTKLQGSVLQNIAPIVVGVTIDNFNTVQGQYRVQAGYGSAVQANVHGNYHVSTRGEPCTFDVNANVHVPNSKFKSFTFIANGKVLTPRHNQQKQKENADTARPYDIQFEVKESFGDDGGHHTHLTLTAKGNRAQGNYKVDLDSSALKAPLRIQGDYQHHTSGDESNPVSGKYAYNVETHIGQDNARVQTVVEWQQAHSVDLLFTMQSTRDNVRDVQLHVLARKVPDDSASYTLLVDGRRNEQQAKLDATIYRGTQKRGVSLTLKLPRHEQPIKVIGIGELLGERKGKLTIDVEHLFDIDVKATGDATFNSLDDFYVHGQWQSERLQLIGYDLTVTAKNKQAQLKLQNAKGVIISGNVAYTYKKEQNKAIVEGQGQLQLHDKAQPINFKLVREVYDVLGDKEVGFSYTLNGNLGSRIGVSTLKLTNKEFNIKLSMCEEHKQCSNLQLQSIHALIGSEDAAAAGQQSPQQSGVQHSLLMLLDLRELGYPYEFELKSRTIRHGLKVQYNIDANAISSASQRKYQLNVQWRPQGGHVQLHLPERDVVLETKCEHPNTGIIGHYEHSISFWLDKTKHPQDQISIIARGDVNGDAQHSQLNARGTLSFQHPKVRTLSINGHVDASQRPAKVVDAQIVFDIFRLPEQQITATSRWRNTLDAGGMKHGFNITTEQSIVSRGLNWQYDLNSHVAFDAQRLAFSNGVEAKSGITHDQAAYYLAASRERVEFRVHALDQELVQVIGEFADRQQQRHGASKWHATLQVFGQSPLVITREVQPSHASLSIQRADGIDFGVQLDHGKQLNVHLNGEGKQLLQGHVALDPTNFLQTTYTSDKNGINAFWNSLRARSSAQAETVRQKIHERFDRFRQTLAKQRELAQQSVPDFSALKASYDQQANAIVKELEQDEALKQIIQSYHDIFEQLKQIMETVSKSGANLYEQLHETFVVLHVKVEELIDGVLLPAWEDFLMTASNIVSKLIDGITVFYVENAEIVLHKLEEYGPKFNSYIKSSAEVIRPIVDALIEWHQSLVQLGDELLDDLKAHIGEIPTLEHLRDEIEQYVAHLQLSERILRIVHELFEQLHVLPQTPEVTEFLQRTQAYFENKLKNQSVDDQNEIDELLVLLAHALRSIWDNLIVAGGGNGSDTAATLSAHAVDRLGVHSFWTALFDGHSHNWIERLTTLLNFRFSVFNYLLNEDFASYLQDPENLFVWLQNIQYSPHAHIIDGQHIITFDGHYYNTQNGNCRYVLAQDSVDNNFTVVAQLNNNKLKAITLTDRNGNYMEVNDAGALKVNGQPQEYPYHDGDMHTWRKYYTINLLSSYGVEVHCTTDLRICHVVIDTFFQTKVRGLFGNANSEPYDDLIKPDGRLARDIIELSASYALGGKCPAIASAESTGHSDICNELFGFESPLITGYLFITAKPYRQACDVAVGISADKDKEAAACQIATAYASALRVDELPSTMPTRCLKCSGGAANQRDLGSEFTVKLPNNKADVVFVVDLNVAPQVMQNLVAPAINEVRETLKSRGLTDVQTSVIAYNISEQHPALLTSDNGKTNYHGNLANVQLHGPVHALQEYVDAEDVVLSDEVETVVKMIRDLIEHIVPHADELAFKMALNYPFRAAAAKSIVIVRAEPLSYHTMIRLFRARYGGHVSTNELPTLNVITPLQELSLEGVKIERIVGFNSRIVASVDGKDARKRSKLQYKTDLAIDYVLNNNGWIFPTQNFNDLSAADQKKALNQVTNVIADTLFKTEITSDCQCVSVYGGLHAQHQCVVKTSNFLPNKKPKPAA